MVESLSSYLNAAGNFGSGITNTMSSGLSYIGSSMSGGLSGASGYLSSLAGPATQQPPTYTSPRTLSSSPTMNVPNASFGSGPNFDIFKSQSAPNSSFTPQSTPVAGQGFLSSIGNFFGGSPTPPSPSIAKQIPGQTQSGQPTFTPLKVEEKPVLKAPPSTQAPGDIVVKGIDLSSDITNVYTAYGKGQTEIKNAKLVQDEIGGSFGVYQTRPARPGFTPIYGFQVSGGSQGAAQSGQFSKDKPLTSLVYTQEGAGTTLSSTSDMMKEKTGASAADILAHPEQYSRLGAEAYGGYVQKLDNRILSPSNLLSEYAADSGNLANFSDPLGPNRSKRDMANEKIPWQVPWASTPAFSTVFPSKEDQNKPNVTPVVGGVVSKLNFDTAPEKFITKWEYADKNMMPGAPVTPSGESTKIYTKYINPAWTEYVKSTESKPPSEYIRTYGPIGPKPATAFDTREYGWISSKNPAYDEYSKDKAALTPAGAPVQPITKIDSNIQSNLVNREFMLPEDVIVASPQPVSNGGSIFDWFRPKGATEVNNTTFNLKDINAGIVSPIVGTASAADQPSGGMQFATQTGGVATALERAATPPSTITPITQSGIISPIVPTTSDLSTKQFVTDDLFKARDTALNNVDTLKSDLSSSQRAILAAGATGGYDSSGVFRYQIDPNNKTQFDLDKKITGQQAVVDKAVSDANAMPLTPYTGAAVGAGAAGNNDIIGSVWGGADTWLKENVTKHLPGYEGTGVGLLKIADAGVEGLSGIEKGLGITPYYEKENAYNLLPSQKFLSYVRPEGFTKTVYAYDPLTDLTKKTVVTTGGTDVMNPDDKIAGGARFVQSAIAGAYEMPKEKPMETLTWLAMPGAFKAGEGLLGYAGTKMAKGLVTNPWVRDGATILKTGMMGTFVGGEGAKVLGYTLDPLAPATGGNEGRILGRTIEGYDKDNQPIYASQSTSATGRRFGQFGMGLGLMGFGTASVAPYKFAFKNELKMPEKPTFLEGKTKQASSYLRAKQQPFTDIIQKIPDVFKAMKSEKSELTQKPSTDMDMLSKARSMFEYGGKAAEGASEQITTTTGLGARTSALTQDIIPTSESPVFTSTKVSTTAQRALTPEEFMASKAGNKVSSEISADTMKILKEPSVSRFGVAPEATSPIETKIELPNYRETSVIEFNRGERFGGKSVVPTGSAEIPTGSITLPERGSFGSFEMGETGKSLSISQRLARATDILKSSDATKVQRSTAVDVRPVEPIAAEVKPSVPAKTGTFVERNLPSLANYANRITGKGSSIGEVKAPVAEVKLPQIAEEVAPGKIKQAPRTMAEDFPQLEQVVYETNIKTGKFNTDIKSPMKTEGGFIAEKGSIATQVEIAALLEKGETLSSLRAKGIIPRNVKDIDILAEKPEVFNRLMADGMKAELESRGYSNVKVKVVYPEGNRFDFKLGRKTYNLLPEKVAGPRNYANRAYEISAKTPDGRSISFKQESGIDLKLYGMDQPLAASEGRYNIRSLFTPGEERATGMINSMFLTPGSQKQGIISGYRQSGLYGMAESLSPGKFSQPKSIAETILGPSTVREKYEEDYFVTAEGKVYTNPARSGAFESTDMKPTTMSKIDSTITDKMDNVGTIMERRLSRNPSAIEENTKLGKSYRDIEVLTNIKKEYYRINEPKLTPKQKAIAQKQLSELENSINIFKKSEIDFRARDGSIQRAKGQDLIDAYSSKVESSFGGSAIIANPKTMSPVEAYDARVFASGKSATALTPKGIAGLQLSAQGRLGKNYEGPGSRNFYLDRFKSTTEEKPKSDSKGKSGKIPASVSASSGVKMPGMISLGPSKQSSTGGFKPSASASSGGSKGESKPSSSKEKSDGSSGGSKSSSTSSSSSSTSYSLSQSGSSSSGSGSSSSMGSRSGSSSYVSLGAPFLAPGGGGGGGGGARGHAAFGIKNPLEELRVAGGAKKFKKMFDFSLPNALAKQSLGNIKQTQPYGTGGAAGAYSRGASSAVQEASSIVSPVKGKDLTTMGVSQNIAGVMAVRKAKKSKPNMRTKSKSKKKLNDRFDLDVSDNLKFAKKKGAY